MKNEMQNFARLSLAVHLAVVCVMISGPAVSAAENNNTLILGDAQQQAQWHEDARHLTPGATVTRTVTVRTRKAGTLNLALAGHGPLLEQRGLTLSLDRCAVPWVDGGARCPKDAKTLIKNTTIPTSGRNLEDVISDGLALTGEAGVKMGAEGNWFLRFHFMVPGPLPISKEHLNGQVTLAATLAYDDNGHSADSSGDSSSAGTNTEGLALTGTSGLGWAGYACAIIAAGLGLKRLSRRCTLSA